MFGIENKVVRIPDKRRGENEARDAQECATSRIRSSGKRNPLEWRSPESGTVQTNSLVSARRTTHLLRLRMWRPNTLSAHYRGSFSAGQA